MIQTVALSTTSFFSYTPTQDQIRAAVAKKLNRTLKSLPKDADAKTDPELYKAFQEAKDELIAEEKKLPYTKRKVEGDASETGLVKFIQPLLAGGPNGCYDLGGLEGIRDTYPIVPDIVGDPSMIPFSSDIKFNLIIRDMNPAVKNPTTKEDNMCVFMKGAPERVLGRCTKILVNGKEEELDEVAMFGVQSANDRFGGMGERVLAFARTQLDPTIFKKDPAYPFDVKKWKTWKEVREFDSAISGWFPMWNLTLVGIVSL
jgi:sodium/potassium-transporting ATPase subunit alpha